MIVPTAVTPRSRAHGSGSTPATTKVYLLLMRHPAKPLAVTVFVAVLSTAALALAIALGWLGVDVGRGATFCEAARDGLIRQPANTYSNLGFVVSGLLIARHAYRIDQADRVLGGARATAFAVVVTLIGPSSAAMHATQSAWGGHLDLLSMYLIASFAAAWAIARLLGRPSMVWGLFVGLVVGCELVGLISTDVPVVRFSGNLAFGVLLIAALAGEVVLARRHGLSLRWGLAAAATMVLALGIWIASQHSLCDPHSLLQGHAAWHLLNAAAAYFLYRHYASEKTVSASFDGAGNRQ